MRISDWSSDVCSSDRGTISIALGRGGVVVIEDPGHDMSPEEISVIYARMARGGDGGRNGSGIGLDLIARLCEHLGWRLEIEPRAPRGTRRSEAHTSELQSLMRTSYAVFGL